MADAQIRDCQLASILRKGFLDGRNQRSTFFLPDLGASLIDPVQFDLIEAGIAGYGGVVAVGFHGEVEVRLAGDDDVDGAMQVGDGELVGGGQAGLRRCEGPGADARVCGSGLKKGEQRKE